MTGFPMSKTYITRHPAPITMAVPFSHVSMPPAFVTCSLDDLCDPFQDLAPPTTIRTSRVRPFLTMIDAEFASGTTAATAAVSAAAVSVARHVVYFMGISILLSVQWNGGWYR